MPKQLTSIPRNTYRKISQRWVMGVVATSNSLTEEQTANARAFGHELSRLGMVLATVGFYGLPYEASLAASQHKGFTIGYSTAISKQEHVDLHRPADAWDVIVYSGLDMANCQTLFLRSLDALVLVANGKDKLVELSVPVPDSMLIGILVDTDGVSNEVQKMVEVNGLRLENTLFDTSPKKLITRLHQELKKRRL